MNQSELEKLNNAFGALFDAARGKRDQNIESLSGEIKDICGILRIKKIRIIKAPHKVDVMLHGAPELIVYEDENFTEGKSITCNYSIPGFLSIQTVYYQNKGDEEWTDSELIQLKNFDSMLYALNGWYQLINYVSYIENHDARFQVYNHNRIKMYIKDLIDKGTIKDYGIVFFNLHHFSFINKQIGEEEATRAMGQYFQLYVDLIGENGAVANMGADNGVVVFKKEIAAQVLDLVRGKTIEFHKSNGGIEDVTFTCCAGLNMNLGEIASEMEVLTTVGNTMYAAKATRRATIIEYDEKFREGIGRRQYIEDVFMSALEKEEFCVYYQPKINLHDFTLCGAEALVRWKHEGTVIFPDQFIPVLESNFSIQLLDMYMLKHVCADIRKWLDEGKNVKTVSVNLSRCSIEIDGLVQKITDIVDSYNVPRKYIQIELTESTSEVDPLDLRNLIEGLRKANISTAVDDFGTGFSSLSLIRDYPWNVLKIDKSLLHGALTEGSRENFMFKSIISLANGLGLDCIVEGVETREEVQLLKSCGCFMAQGYFFDRPIGRNVFETRMGTVQ